MTKCDQCSGLACGDECDGMSHTSITAEPEPCEDAREVAVMIHRDAKQIGEDWECDEELLDSPEEMARLQEAVIQKTASTVHAYASQVADRRAEDMRGQCNWAETSFDAYRYHTDCGVNYHTGHGGEVKDGKYRYCPYCGRSMIVTLASEVLAATEQKPSFDDDRRFEKRSGVTTDVDD